MVIMEQEENTVIISPHLKGDLAEINPEKKVAVIIDQTGLTLG